MLADNQKELLRNKTCRLLETEGLKVESEELVQAMLQRGCEQTPSQRVRIPAKLIEEMADKQKQTQRQDDEDQELMWQCGPDWAHDIIWNRRQGEFRDKFRTQFLMSAFDCGPTLYHDYAGQENRPIDTEIHIEMCKFAQATPEVGYMSTWYRQDVPAKIERLESLVMGLKYTDK